MQQRKSHYSRGFSNLVDLGCGTGVLPIVLSENAGYSGPVYSLDNQPNAIEATTMNSQLFGMGSRVRAVEADIVELYFKDAEAESQKTDQAKELAFYR